MTTTPDRTEEPLTFEKVWAMLQENALQMKEIDRRVKEIERILKESEQETDRIIEENWERIGGRTKSDDELAEEHFYTSMESKMTFAGQHYVAIERGRKRKRGALEGYYDMVLYNDDSVAIIQVESKAKTEHLEELVTKKLPDFRTLFPLYRDYPIYLGIGSMSFDDQVLLKAKELGIGILRPKGDTIEADTGAVRAYR